MHAFSTGPMATLMCFEIDLEDRVQEMPRYMPRERKEGLRVLPLLMFDAQGNRMFTGDDLCAFLTHSQKDENPSQIRPLKSVYGEFEVQSGLSIEGRVHKYLESLH